MSLATLKRNCHNRRRHVFARERLNSNFAEKADFVNSVLTLPDNAYGFLFLYDCSFIELLSSFAINTSSSVPNSEANSKCLRNFGTWLPGSHEGWGRGGVMAR